nr:MAG TPA_asm: hypothetical protein [Bacteriophage sp.]
MMDSQQRLRILISYALRLTCSLVRKQRDP